jgi:hypothetical protein
MQLDLNISDRMVRKLRALNILEGGHTPESIEALVVTMLEKTIDNQIKSHLGEDAQPVQVKQRPAIHFGQNNRESYQRMETEDFGVSDGLGDFDEGLPEPEHDEEAFVPKKGGLSDKQLDSDMDVDDPEHEAKAEAAAYPPDVRAEDILADVVGIPFPTPSGPVETDARISKRKRTLKIRGKVSGATEENLNDFF